MSTPARKRDEMQAADAILKAFGFRASPTQAALSIFPARMTRDPTVEASEVNEYLAKVKRLANKKYRMLSNDVHEYRECGVERPDTALKFMFQCRKMHVYMKSEGDNVPNSPASSNAAPSIGAPSSPFLRRSASRDPIHRIKDEPFSPMPLSQVNGTPIGSTRSRSKLRSHSMSSNVKDSPASMFNSVEKATSAVNPMYFNNTPSTPGRPLMRSPGTSFSSKAARVLPAGLPQPSASVRPVEPPPYPGKPITARTGTVPSIPHESLNRELRGALQGIAGAYFINNGRGSLVISKTCAISESSAAAIEVLLSLGNSYLDLKSQCARWSGRSVTRDALIGVASTILDEYISDVGDIPLKNAGNRGPVILAAGVSDWNLRLDALRRSMARMSEGNCEMLESLYVLWRAVSGTEAENVMTRVLDSTMGVFCNALRSWINHGKLITDDQWIIDATSTTSDFGYKIKHRPSFMSNIDFENVLKIGTSQSLVPESELERLEDFRNLVDVHVTAQNIYSAEGRIKINRIFCQMADWVGKRVVERLMNEGHLMLHLKAARKFLLLDDAEFAGALYRCIQRKTTGFGMSRHEAFSAFVMAIKQSTMAGAFPFKVVIDTMASPEGTPIGSARTQFMQSIHPVYTIKGIAENVFRGVQPGYETLFHFIWSIQTALFQAEGVCERLRQCQREAAHYDSTLSLHRIMSAVGARFHRILLQIRQYTLAAISDCSSRFHARLSEITDVESASDQHVAFLDDLQTSLFCDFDQERIFQRISSILQQANELSKQSLQFEETLLEQDLHSNTNASETLRDFEAAELSVVLSELKTKVKVTNATFSKALADLLSQLTEVKDRNQLVSIILTAQ